MNDNNDFYEYTNWIIQSNENKEEFWNEKFGWVREGEATTFVEDTKKLGLPINGVWVLFCMHDETKTEAAEIIHFEHEKFVIIEHVNICIRCKRTVGVGRSKYMFDEGVWTYEPE